MKTILLLSCVAGIFVALPSPGDSRGPARAAAVSSGEAAQMPDPGSMRRQYLGTVAEADSATRMLVVRDETQGLFTMHADERTQITQGDKSASWSDIRVGMMVDGMCIGTPGSAYAETIHIGR